MRITDLSVDGFGVWHDLELRRFSPEVTVFHGLNEAGKTTLMQFLRSVLYGVSAERRECYLPPVNGGRPGGKLGLLTDDGPFTVARYADRGANDPGRVTVHLPDGTQQGDRLLREVIEHVDEPTFNNVFAVGLDEIQYLGTLGGSEAAQWIYRLTSGLDRISLYDVILGLRSSQRNLLGGEGARSEIVRLLGLKEQLEAQIEELAGQTRTWCQRGVEIAEIDVRVAELREELRERERRARRVEIALGIRTQWSKRIEVERGIAALAGLYPLEDDAITQLDELNDRIEEHQRQRDILKGQRHQLRDEAEKLGINEVLVENTCRIEALAEQQEWLESLAAQTQAYEEEAKQLNAKFEAETRRLAQQWFNDPNRRLMLSAEQIERLAPQRSAVENALKQLATAEREYQEHQTEEERYRSQIESATSTSEQLGLPADLHSAGELVARLRRRLQVEQKIEQSRRSAGDLEQQARDMLEEQVTPLRLYAVSVIATAVAVGLTVAYWMTENNPQFAQAAFVLGAIGLGIPLYRWGNEARNAEDLDNIQRQIEQLDRQHQEAKAEKEKLDAELPITEGSVVLRLQTAERHLAELQEMLPVESQRRKVSEASRTAKQRYDSARERLAAAERDWKGQLKALGLPQELSAKELTLLAGQYEQLAQLEAKAQSRLDDMQRRQREFDRVVTRIERLAQESNLVLADADPLAQLEHLLQESRLQKAHLTHRDKLQERAKELKFNEARHARAAIGLTQNREAMFKKAGVDHETAFRKLAADLAEAARLRSERDSLTREIAAAIGTFGTEQDFAELLAPEVVGSLDKQWDSLTAEHMQVEEQLDNLVKERATLIEQQRQLADDTTLPEKQIELGAIAAQLERAQEAWRERATVSLMLERVRADYEKNRQPETLVEASSYFRELTGGQYTRIWTPLANDILLVDKADGQSLSVDRLSRGTREQLFLSVRMALVATFGRRGIQLPMILDDVLVNYDEKRAAQAAKVLCQFAAQGHQLLIFSCHEHILQIFRKLGADCRRLPNRFADLFEEEPLELEEELVEEVVEEFEEELEEVAEVVDEIEEEPMEIDFAYTGGIAPRDLAEPEMVDLVYTATILPREAARVSVEADTDEVEYQWSLDEHQKLHLERRAGEASPSEEWMAPVRVGHAG